MELVRESIQLEQRIGREKTQILLEGDIIVPDVKPDMAVLLQTEADVCIDKWELSTDRVNFTGRLDFQVLYLAKTPERPVHSMKASAAIDDFINMEGLSKDMWVELSAELINIEYRMLNDRKISYRAVVTLEASGENTHSQDVVVNMIDIPESQLLKKKLIMSKNIANKEDRFIVKDSLPIPSGKPNIREILLSGVVIGNREEKVMAGRVNITGEILVTTLYKGDADDSIIEFVEHELPFNGMVDISDVQEHMQADIALIPQQQYIQVQPDSDGEDRVLEMEVAVNAKIKVRSQTEIDVLEDAYSIDKRLEMTRSPVVYAKPVCRNKNQFPVKEVVLLEDGCPGMLQIFRVTGKAQMDDVKVIEDKVVVEGIIHTSILYVAESDDSPLYSFNTVLPYRQVIETRGAKPDMDVKVDVSIEHTGFNMLSDRETEVRFLLSFNTRVNEEKEVSMITDIDFIELDKEYLDSMANMTVYVVQNGDTLWKIAKRYNTDLEELISINDIENPSSIYPGQKLLILKKINVE